MREKNGAVNRAGLCSVIAIATAMIVSGCVQEYSSDQRPCPCADGWKCCGDTCVLESDQCPGDGGSVDAGDCLCMQGWKCCQDTCILEDAECSEGGNRACGCLNPLDAVYADPSEFGCYRKDFQCNALDLCEVGYECDNHNRCVCKDLDLCGIDCSEDCNCPEGSVCDPATHICRMPLICLDDDMCPDGAVCRPTMGSVSHYICMEPDGSQVGETCQRGMDCNSGICHTNVCLQFCTGNADCPGGQYCSEVDLGEAGCVSETDCGPACSGPEQYCAERGNECVSDYCRTGGDCEGDCGHEIDRPLLGKCLPVDFPQDTYCDDDEFVHTPYAQEGFCLIFKACWTDADCPAPYQCLDGDTIGVPPPSGSGLCGRQQ